ncbi:lytic transglycosylase domain-containing protein [Pararhodonellum marinum]|uniref:lytic transglycosylase domain-containing protein n=1 Tax=Pararhodonellum marinum TaxID=2755358 RepID=UPI00188EC06C|nr:lytic transglycosylase domain-containing protein [Pararhodonellum marinum]
MKTPLRIKNFFLSLAFMGLTGTVLSQDLADFVSWENELETLIPIYDFEYIPDFTYAEVEARVKQMDSDMSFELNERIFAFINYFVVRNRSYSKMVLARKDTYFPIFEENLAKHEVPDDLKFLAIIESGLNPSARSRVGAMGLWQFMPATGKVYNLHVTKEMDYRMDPELSTEAAVKYLKSLYRMFGDWELAMAAYNCGPGNVRKAIRRSGGKKTFWEIYDYLPRETRSYVPQFQAMMYVFRYADEHNLILEEATFPIRHERIRFDQEVDLERLAEISGMCIEDLEYLNPAIINRKIPVSHQQYALRVPLKKAAFLTENMDWITDSLNITIAKPLLAKDEIKAPEPIKEFPKSSQSNKITYRVQSGDVLGTIARKHGTTVNNLMAWNDLSSNMIKVGQTLVIYTDQRAATHSNSLASNEQPSTASSETAAVENSQKIYTVQPGDSLWLISRKLSGVTIDQIKKLNNLNDNRIKPGQKLIIG